MPIRLVRWLFLGACIVLLAAGARRAPAPSLYGFGNEDGNDLRCNALGTGALKGCTAGQCTQCSAVLLSPINVSDACSGSSHTVVLLANGSIAATGLNVLLGASASASDTSCNTSFTVLSTWPPARSGLVASQLLCSANFTVILTTNGSVYAFGRNDGGVFGVAQSTTPLLTTPTALTVPGQVAQIAVSLSSVAFLLSNGTVLSTGSGAARGSTSSSPSWAVVNVSADKPCVPGKIVGGLTGFAVVCADNRSVVAWGDNTLNQLSSTAVTSLTTPTVALPNSTALLAPGVTITLMALGVTHTVLLLSNGTVIGRGSNSDGQLGLGLTVPLASDWMQISTAGLPGQVTALSAGQGYTLATTSLRVGVGPTGTTNVFAVGSNSQCALGSDASVSQNTAFQPVQFAALSNQFATRVIANAFRRSLVIAQTTRTWSRTPSVSRPSKTASSEPTSSRTRTPPPTFTKSQEVSSSTSLSAESTLTQSLAPSFSATLTWSPPHTLTAAATITKGTETVTMRAAPKILKAEYDNVIGSILVYFDSATNRPGVTSVNDSTVTPAAMSILIGVSGYAQRLGSTAQGGSWVDATLLFVKVDLATANITLGVAKLVIQKGAQITAAAGSSPIAPLSLVLITTTTIGHYPTISRTSTNMPSWVPILLAMFNVVMLCGILAAVTVFMWRRNQAEAEAKQKAKRDEEQARRQRFVPEIDGEIYPESPQADTAKADLDREVVVDVEPVAPTPEAVRYVATMYGRREVMPRGYSVPNAASPERTARSGTYVPVPDESGEAAAAAARRAAAYNPPPTDRDSTRRMAPSWTSRREFYDDPPHVTFGTARGVIDPWTNSAFTTAAPSAAERSYRSALPTASELIYRNTSWTEQREHSSIFGPDRELGVTVHVEGPSFSEPIQLNYSTNSAAADPLPALATRRPRVFRYDSTGHSQHVRLTPPPSVPY